MVRMYRIFLFLLLLQSLSGIGQTKAQPLKYVVKQQMECEDLNNRPTCFKIGFLRDSVEGVGYTAHRDNECIGQYDFSRYSNREKVKIIKELLAFKGDTSICGQHTILFCAECSSLPPSGIHNHSIQVEALFLIDVVRFNGVRVNCANRPYKVIRSEYKNNHGEYVIESVKGKFIDAAFKSYEKWYRKLKIKGFKKPSHRNKNGDEHFNKRHHKATGSITWSWC